MVCHSLLQWTTFSQTSPPWPVRLGGPHTAWLSFIELDKTLVCVIRLASFLWLWFQCVCPLMPSHNTYCLTWVSLGCGVSLHSCSSKAQLLLLTLEEVALPDLGRGVAPLSTPVSLQPPLLGHGVAPLGCHPWPRAWGSSSQLNFCVVHCRHYGNQRNDSEWTFFLRLDSMRNQTFVPAASPCTHLHPQEVQMNLGKSLLVLKSPIFVEILSFICWWSRFPTLPNRTDTGEGLSEASRAYTLMV